MSSLIRWANRTVTGLLSLASSRLLPCLLCCLAGTPALAQAFSFPGTTPVGSTTHPIPVNVAIQRAGLLSSVLVLGQ